MNTSTLTRTVATAIRIGEELVKTKPLKYNALVREIARIVGCGQSTAKIAVTQLRTAGNLVNVSGTYTWTAPDDLVFTPFLGIGSEVYTAVKMGRRGIGSELKTAYWKQAIKNMADAKSSNGTLFDCMDDAA